MNIYFAGSIRGGRQDAELYIQKINHLQIHEKVFTEHIGGPNLTPSGEELSKTQIYQRDTHWLHRSHIVVAEVTQPSLGADL